MADTDPIEEWRPIPDWPYYEVSSLGRVRSLDKTVPNPGGGHRLRRGQLLKFLWHKHGYAKVTLYGHDTKQITVNVLVCLAFHGPKPTPKHEAAHWPDRDPANNRADNLRWATHQENEDDKIPHGTRPKGKTHVLCQLNEEQVKEIRRLAAEGSMTGAQIGARFGVSQPTVSAINTRRLWKHLS